MAAANQVTTPLNDPIWGVIKLHGRGSAYRRELAKKGYDSSLSRDFSGHLLSATLTESAGEAAMKLEVEMADDYRGSLTHRSGLTPLTVGTDLHLYGYTMNYMAGGVRSSKPARLFRGQVFNSPSKTAASGTTRSFTAYDPATFLARTDAVLVYNNKSFTEVFRDVCKKYGFSSNFVVDTKVKLGKIIMSPGWNLWTLFQECTRRHYDKTGATFFVRSIPNVSRGIDLLNFGGWGKGEGTGITWHLTDGTGGTLTDFSTLDDAEDVRTRIVMVQEQYDDEGEYKSTAVLRQGIVMGQLRETFGDLVKIITPDSSLESVFDEFKQEWTKIDKAMALQMKQALANHGRTRKTANTTALYLPGARRGDRVVASVAGIDVLTGWVIDAITTTWDAKGPTQTIDLVRTASDSSVGVS